MDVASDFPPAYLIPLLTFSSTLGVRPGVDVQEVLGGVMARVLELVGDFTPGEAVSVLKALEDWKERHGAAPLNARELSILLTSCADVATLRGLAFDAARVEEFNHSHFMDTLRKTRSLRQRDAGTPDPEPYTLNPNA
ncbi:hypothetical protein T484DRAFT_1886084 [Baffinella frigidus]|nr:hypothetical protein T484DRAFT_1886084 [Cryptophyta sp. CCMP2293]